MKRSAILASILATILATLACGSSEHRSLNLYPSATPDASATPEPTQTPRYVQVEVTARPSATLPSPTAAPYRATVRAHAWNCYDAPHGKITGALYAGQLVTVLTNSGGWALIAADGARPACWAVAAALN